MTEEPKAVAPVHPRLRGELKIGGRHQITVFGSSPLTRGTPMAVRLNNVSCRFIPAYAGNSVEPPPEPKNTSVHPRLRGELNCSRFISSIFYGSSPLTRGTQKRFFETVE